MKEVGFSHELVELITEGRKTATWRLFDNKDIKKDDVLVFIDRGTNNSFARAKVLNIREKPIREINEGDFAEGHEKHSNT